MELLGVSPTLAELRKRALWTEGEGDVLDRVEAPAIIQLEKAMEGLFARSRQRDFFSGLLDRALMANSVSPTNTAAEAPANA